MRLQNITGSQLAEYTVGSKKSNLRFCHLPHDSLRNGIFSRAYNFTSRLEYFQSLLLERRLRK